MTLFEFPWWLGPLAIVVLLALLAVVILLVRRG